MATTNKQLNVPAFNDPNWDVPLNANFNYIDSSFGSSLNVASAANVYTISSTQLRNMRIFFSDTLSATGTATIPASYGGFWIFTNTTAGGHDVNVKVLTGANSVAVKNGYSTIIYSNGTECYEANSQKLNISGGTVLGNLSVKGVFSVQDSSAVTKLTFNPNAGTPDLTVTGTITASGNITAFSDERLKRNIHHIDGALGLVNKLRGVRFEDKDGNKYVGLVAQEVLPIIPEAVVQHQDSGYLAVAYQNLVGVLVNAINELEARVKDLENK